jgi:hypothetical protein
LSALEAASQFQTQKKAAFAAHPLRYDKLRGRTVARNAKPNDLISPNGIDDVQGYLLHMLQAVAESAVVAEPELHRFRKTYAGRLTDEGLPVPTVMNRLGRCSAARSMRRSFTCAG